MLQSIGPSVILALEYADDGEKFVCEACGEPVTLELLDNRLWRTIHGDGREPCPVA